MKRRIFLYLFVALTVMIMMSLSPRMGDDYYWTFIQPVQGFDFASLWKMAAVHYETVIGRYSANVIQGFLCAMPDWAYACANTLAYCALATLLCALFCVGMQWRPLFVSLMAIFTLNYDAIAWRCGSGNYLWPALLLSCVSYVFVRSAHDVTESVSLRLGKDFGAILLAFLAAGGHELLDCSAGAVLGIYLVRFYMREKSCPPRRQLLMAAAFAVGAILVVSAPGAWRRAAGSGGLVNLDAGVLWYLSAKGRALMRCLAACPVLVVEGAILLYAMCWRRSLLRDFRVVCSFVYLIVLLLLTCVLSDGCDRTSWFVSVSAIAVLFLQLDALGVGHRRVYDVCGITVACLVLWVAAMQSFRSSAKYREMISEWLASDKGLLVRKDWSFPAPLAWFDNSLRVNNIIKFGSVYPNNLIARANGKPCLIAVTEDMVGTLQGEGRLFLASNFHSRADGGFYSVPDVDLIALECPYECAVGTVVKAHVDFYDVPHLSIFRRIVNRISRPGGTEACPESPAECMVQNFVVQGFVYTSNSRRFAVFLLNRNVPRAAIKRLRLIPPSPTRMSGRDRLIGLELKR